MTPPAMRLLAPDGARQHSEAAVATRRHRPSEAPPEAAAASGRTVAVGIRWDAASRELLTWALVKVANAGDRVVALHVAAGGGGGAGLEERRKAADSLASVLAVYDGFCNLKQINLELKVCGGSSIRKTLVKETASCGAAHLILGVAKNSRSFGSSSTSVAKYCAKRVPTSCSVLAVNNGKIIYQRAAAHEEPFNSTSTPETPRRSYRKLLTSLIGEKTQDECIKDNRSISRAVTMPMRSPTSSKEVSLALVPVKVCRRESPEVATGWPFLRKKLLPNRQDALFDKPKMSVVQWAMRLPSRYSAVSPVHLEHRTTGGLRVVGITSHSKPAHQASGAGCVSPALASSFPMASGEHTWYCTSPVPGCTKTSASSSLSAVKLVESMVLLRTLRARATASSRVMPSL